MSGVDALPELELAQIRSVIDVLPGLVAYYDRDLRIVFANDASLHFFGLTPEQIRGKHLSEIVTAESFQRNLPLARATLAGQRQDFERTVTTADGQIRTVQASYVPHWVGAAVLGISVLVIDVTERHEQQSQLAEEARRLREAQILGRVGSWELDLATMDRSCSEGLLELLGVEPGPDADELAFGCLSDAALESMNLALSTCLSRHESSTLRYDIARRSDGVHRIVEARIEAMLVEGALVAVRGTMADVTEQAEADDLRREALSAQREAATLGRRYEALLETTVEGIIRHGVGGEIVAANAAACSILAISADDLAGRGGGDPRWQAIDETGEPVAAGQHPALQTLRTGIAMRGVTFGIVTPDGVARWLKVDTAPLFDELGELEGVICGFVDVTKAREAERWLAETRNLFAGVLDAALEQSIIAMDLAGRITVFNVGAHRMLGYTPAEVMGRSPALFHDDAELLGRAAELGVENGFATFVEPLVQGAASDTRQWTYVCKDGQRLQVMLSMTGMRDGDGGVTGYIGVATDVTQLRRTEGALAQSEALFRLAFDTAPSGMAMLDEAGQIVRANPALQVITGRTEAELMQLRLGEVAHPDDVAQVGALLAWNRDHEQTARAEFRFSRPDDSIVWGQVGLSPIPAQPGVAPSVICLVEDITTRKEAEATLRHQSFHDALTGLANRTLLHDRITHALAAATRSRTPVGVLFIDLDGFKQVNDTSGHAAGDELLVQVSQRLRRSVRPGDTVARLGGDEFAVLCIDVADSEALAVAAKRVLRELNVPFEFMGGAHRISASIGMQLSDAASEPSQLLADADSAMYRAKREGKNRIASPRLEDQARASRSARLGPELHRAVAMDQFVMFGQPVVDLTHGKTAAVETLIRWQHPSRGLLAPSEFLDVAEQSPLMLAVGAQVMRKSCQMAADWVTRFGPAAPDVHINVSGRQLEVGSLTEDVLATLAEFDLPPEKLVLELTETHMPSITNSLKNDLNQLRDRGIRIAIDDLGTGYSTLTRITELPVDILKIDLRFTAGLGTDPACQAIVRAVLSMGEELGLSVVAEGVETLTQETLLRSYGCTMVQGYRYSRPLPGTELLTHLGRSETPAA